MERQRCGGEAAVRWLLLRPAPLYFGSAIKTEAQPQSQREELRSEPPASHPQPPKPPQRAPVDASEQLIESPWDQLLQLRGEARAAVWVTDKTLPGLKVEVVSS